MSAENIKKQEETVDIIVLKIKNNQPQYGPFSKHLENNTIVPIGSNLISKEDLAINQNLCEVMFVVDGESFFISKLHELIRVEPDNLVPDYYTDVAVDSYDLNEMNTIYVVRDLREIPKKEFLALVGRYHRFQHIDKVGRVKFQAHDFLSNRADRTYLSK